MNKIDVFIKFVLDLAKLSHCKRRQTACVIVPDDLSNVLSIGYNGPPALVSNDACTGLEGDCGCIHAEANALIKLHTSAVGLMMITKCAPCKHCAGLIINSKAIRLVTYLEDYRNVDGLDLLKQRSIGVIKYAGIS